MAYKAPIPQAYSHVDEVLKSIDSLPQTLRNVYSQIKDLDAQQQQLEQGAEGEILEALKSNPPKDKERVQSLVQELANKVRADCIEISDKKIALAQNGSDIVAGLIRGIDEKLAKFEDQLRKEGRWPADAPGTKVHRPAPEQAAPQRVAAAPKASNPPSHQAPQGVRTGNTTVVNDVPVDPNEPRYCHCRQVSYGEMIACENTECPYEWFHFQCVGLTETPSGPWRCPDCKRNMRR